MVYIFCCINSFCLLKLSSIAQDAIVGFCENVIADWLWLLIHESFGILESDPIH